MPNFGLNKYITPGNSFSISTSPTDCLHLSCINAASDTASIPTMEIIVRNLAVLPEELLLQIFSVFQEHHFHRYCPSSKTKRKTLQSIYRVSRQFRRIAQPLLYHSLPPWNFYNNTCRQMFLARTLSESVYIRTSVRKFVWRFRDFVSESNLSW